MEQYDFIIAGSGAAGLSLAYYISLSPQLKDCSVLLLDKELKNRNDRTWGFWTKEATPFESIVSYSFGEAEFLSSTFSAALPLAPYRYQVLEGLCFYNFIREQLRPLPNFVFLQEEIRDIRSEDKRGVVITERASYSGKWVFNSCFLPGFPESVPKKEIFLKQHFKGWVVETQQAVFDPGRVRLFDFRIPPKGRMQFMYLIPHSPNRALVEYTLFSEHLLEPSEYEQALTDYIRNVLKLENYSVKEEEWGVIPMTTYKFPQKQGKRIIQTGTLGGASKPSTGYTFLRVQQQCREVVRLLEKGEAPYVSMQSGNRFTLYDAMLLNLIWKKGGAGEQVFSQLFRGNPVQRIFRFLDEETHPGEEFLIMNSVPRSLFVRSLLNLKLGLPFSSSHNEA